MSFARRQTVVQVQRCGADRALVEWIVATEAEAMKKIMALVTSDDPEIEDVDVAELREELRMTRACVWLGVYYEFRTHYCYL